MFDQDGPLLLNALYGTLFTWGLTAAGAALVFFFRKTYRKFLDASLGFAAGVMTAASFWSLIAPAIEMAEESGAYGDFAFVPVAIGFALGAGFVLATDWGVAKIGMNSQHVYDAIFQTDTMQVTLDETAEAECPSQTSSVDHDTTLQKRVDPESQTQNINKSSNRRKKPQKSPQKETTIQLNSNLGDSKDQKSSVVDNSLTSHDNPSKKSSSSAAPPTAVEDVSVCDSALLCFNKLYRQKSWHRMLLLVIAITVHNIPEGLAVGVAFGAVGKSTAASFNSAKTLALGIGIQNFPEGLAVSLPLRGLGMSAWKAFLWGQFSGMVEPIFGILGCWAVTLAEPVLPYALAFAAGAMIWVVFDDIMPEAHSAGNGKIASIGSIVGFIVMMSLDVALG